MLLFCKKKERQTEKQRNEKNVLSLDTFFLWGKEGIERTFDLISAQRETSLMGREPLSLLTQRRAKVPSFRRKINFGS
jgi:hypothetical protein